MDGLTFLANLMRLRPMPVVMISTLTQKGARTSLEALHLGAIDYVAKPQTDVTSSFEAYTEEIIGKVKLAASANVAAISRRGRGQSQPRPSACDEERCHLLSRSGLQRIIGIGASTGGTEAIAELLAGMPAASPPIVVAQHIPEMFSKSFSERVNKLSRMQVREARDGERALVGHAYIAPGSSHLSIRRSGSDYVCVLDQNEPVNRHRPSVDVLFESLARTAGPNAVGIMLTGMGSDGARGLKAMKDAGARTFAQDKATSVVWGMPGSAVELGAVDKILALEKMAGEVIRAIKA